ncbi:hypothetical protein BKA80DRAFT_140005 [Phyllosticta citrichinensis]
MVENLSLVLPAAVLFAAIWSCRTSRLASSCIPLFHYFLLLLSLLGPCRGTQVFDGTLFVPAGLFNRSHLILDPDDLLFRVSLQPFLLLHHRQKVVSNELVEFFRLIDAFSGHKGKACSCLCDHSLLPRAHYQTVNDKTILQGPVRLDESGPQPVADCQIARRPTLHVERRSARPSHHGSTA